MEMHPKGDQLDSGNAELIVLTITGDVVAGPMSITASMKVERVRLMVALAWGCTPAAVLLTDGCAQLSDESALVECVGSTDGTIVITAAMSNFEQIYRTIIDGIAAMPRVLEMQRPSVRPAARWKSQSARVKLKLQKLARDAGMEHLPPDVHLWLQILFANATFVMHQGFLFNPESATCDLDIPSLGAVKYEFCTMRAAPGGIVYFSIGSLLDDAVLYMVDCNGQLAEALFDPEGNTVVQLIDDCVDVLAKWEPYDVELIVRDPSHAMKIMNGLLPDVEDVAPHLGISQTAADQFGLRSWGLGTFTDSQGKSVSIAQHEDVKWPVSWKRTMTSPSKPGPGAVWLASVMDDYDSLWRHGNENQDFLTPSFWRNVREDRIEDMPCQVFPRPVAPTLTAFFSNWAETGVLPI